MSAPARIHRVVGLDLSLTSTGVGVCVRTLRGVHMASSSVTSRSAATGPVVATTKKRKEHRKETLDDRIARQRRLTEDICHFACRADLVVIEGLFTGPTAGSIIDRAALWFRVIDRVRRHEVPVGVLAPLSIKKAITDDAKADKAAMAGALVNLYPELVIKNSDEADAMGMAHLGAVLLDWPTKTLVRHREVRWTDHPEDTGGALVALVG